MEPAETKITLGQLPVGGRLIVRSRIDWRFAVVARIVEENIYLTISSPSGRTYRLRRDTSAALSMDNAVPVLVADRNDEWKENFSPYDRRW